MTAFHPELRLARYVPRFSFGPRVVAFVRRFMGRGRPPVLNDILVEDHEVPADGPHPSVSLRVYRPRAGPASAAAQAPTAALYWMHGGGFVMGSPEWEEARSLAFVRALGITVAAVRYRVAPEHPAPAALDDAYAGLRWLHAQAESLGIDPDRIALGGASAGAGLAATLALRALDAQELRPAFQLLVYPMLDDRTVLRTDLDTRDVRVWSAESNAWAWSVYLGHPPGAADTSPYAAAARRDDLRGLPPAWIGVGTLDLFHDEDVAFAERLRDAGVPCALHVVPGAFHGFDAVFLRAEVTHSFFAAQVDALRAGLGLAG